jgi:hypothetical protein
MEEGSGIYAWGSGGVGGRSNSLGTSRYESGPHRISPDATASDTPALIAHAFHVMPPVDGIDMLSVVDFHHALKADVFHHGVD